MHSSEHSHGWAAALAAMEPVSLEGLDRVKLMNRVDSKYVFDVDQLEELLQETAPHYQVLEMEHRRIFTYHSIYLDTPEFDFYRHHHNGKLNRVKVRYRRYVDSGTAFFEVKRKTKGIRTDKRRIRLEEVGQVPGHEEQELLLALNIPAESLEHKVLICYRRITLAAKQGAERVTLDLQLAFSADETELRFPSLVIAEVKQDRLSAGSPFIRSLKSRRISRLRISKYAVAVALTRPWIKANQFKSKIRKLTSILQKHGTYRTA